MNEEQTQKKKIRNYAFAEGYLRECKLERGTTQTGRNCLKGEVTVAINRCESQRIRVFAFKEDSTGKTDKRYAALEELLSPNIQSIASYLATVADPSVNIENLDQGLWEAATKVAAKVWMSGSLEEYLTITSDDNGVDHETSSYSFRASNGGIKKETDKRPFNPRLTADLDGRILQISPEMKRAEGSEEAEETGRQIIKLLYIDYKGAGQVFKIYAPDTSISQQMSTTFADYVKDNYGVNQTAKFTVALKNMAITSSYEPKNKGWGISSGPIITTKFTHELELIGGRTAGGIDDESNPDYITNDEAKVALSMRLSTGKENGEKKLKKGIGATQPKGFGTPAAGNAFGDASFPTFSADDLAF